MTCGVSISNLNGVRFTRYSEGKPDRYTCKQLLDRIDERMWKNSIIYPVEGFYSCVLTSEGRYGWVYYESSQITDYKEATVKLKYYIWSND